MTITCVTSFSPEGWETYARQCVANFKRHWPMDVKLLCYWEGEAPKTNVLTGHDLLETEPCKSFIERHKDNLVVQGRQQASWAPAWKPRAVNEGYNWRLNAFIWARKVFAMAHAARQAKTGRMFWIDADVDTHTDVPVSFLHELLPDDVDICYIPRDRYHPETGLIGFNLNRPAVYDFLTAFEDIYATDNFLSYPEWHDAAIFNYLLPRLHLRAKPIKNHSRRHPFEASVLAKYMTHYKGSRKHHDRLLQREQPRFIKGSARSGLSVLHEASGWWLPRNDTYFHQFLTTETDKRMNQFDKDHLHEAFKYVRQWRIACDVGAHVGFWTLDMAERFERVYAFEPAEDCYACLEQNLTDHKNVTLYNVAVGASMGHCHLSDDRKRPGNTGSRFVQPSTHGRIRMLSLDALDLPCCDLLKIDVEGFELKVLEGAEWLIRKSRPVIIIETDKRFEHRYGLPVMAAQSFILERDYDMVARMRPDRIFVPKEHLRGHQR